MNELTFLVFMVFGQVPQYGFEVLDNPFYTAAESCEMAVAAMDDYQAKHGLDRFGHWACITEPRDDERQRRYAPPTHGSPMIEDITAGRYNQ